MKKDNDTFIVQLTVGELIEILKEAFPILSSNSESKHIIAEGPSTPSDGPTFSGRLVYGLRGIENLFNISHKKAQEWKDTWLAPAIWQCGRKIITDADYAFKLYNGRKK